MAIHDNIGFEEEKPFSDLTVPYLDLDQLLEEGTTDEVLNNDDLSKLEIKHGVIHEMKYLDVVVY